MGWGYPPPFYAPFRIRIGAREGILRNFTVFSRGVFSPEGLQNCGDKAGDSSSISCSYNFIFWPPASQIKSTAKRLL